jgi:hypothetical protein
MKKCAFCKRVVYGKLRLGLCPLHFANLIDGLAVFPGIPALCILYVVSPIDIIPELALGPIALTDDMVLSILGFAAQIFLIYRIAKRIRHL